MIMPTLKEYREQARLSLSELSRLANVDFKTAKKADLNIREVSRIKAIALIDVINKELGLNLTIQDID